MLACVVLRVSSGLRHFNLARDVPEKTSELSSDGDADLVRVQLARAQASIAVRQTQLVRLHSRVPCRVGVVRQQEALQRLVDNRPMGSKSDELVMLKEMAQAMRDASICGLGQTAASALESALQRWNVFA